MSCGSRALEPFQRLLGVCTNLACFDLDAIIRSGPADFLKEHGFRKKRRVFFREINGVFQYVHFFSSKWASTELAAFTLQVGVTFRHRHPKPPENMLTDLIPVVGRRFGPDLDHPIGQFWASDSVDPTASEVVERLKNHVMPFFDRHPAQEVTRIWEAGGRVVQLPTLQIPRVPKAEPGVPPNGGPAESRGDSGVSGGPPSVS